MNASSGFWMQVRLWAEEDPLLVIGGTIAAIANLLLIRNHRIAGIFGLFALSLWAIFARGQVIGFYLVPVLPLLALNLAFLIGTIVRWSAAIVERAGNQERFAGRITQVGLVMGCFLVLGSSFTTNDRQIDGSFWEERPVVAQTQMIDWVHMNIPAGSLIVTDNYAWIDLNAPPPSAAGAAGRMGLTAHYYWKIDTDPEVRDGILLGRWESIDYLLVTHQMKYDAEREADSFPILNQALANSSAVTEFEVDGYQVQLRVVNNSTLEYMDHR